MAETFCTHCGNRLTGVKKFCAECGSPVGGETETKGRSPVRDAQLFERLGLKVFATGSSRQPPKPAPLTPPHGTSQPMAPSRVSGTGERVEVILQRVWEPNERAFTVFVPKGWKINGGIFNVSAFQTHGVGNTMSPKCDFAVKRDDQGTMMIRWMPSWNYADLSFAGSAAGYFQPGQWYQGMPVRLMVSAKQFLVEMLCAARPQGSGLTVITEDPMSEITAAYDKQAEQVNELLRQRGLPPLRFESLAMLVEYSEGGQHYRECVTTSICDSRPSAFMWTNDNTLMLRAPAADFDSWYCVLNKIQTSREVNPDWLAAVLTAMGQRAVAAWKTQQDINRIASQILASRQKTNAEARDKHDVYMKYEEDGDQEGGKRRKDG